MAQPKTAKHRHFTIKNKSHVRHQIKKVKKPKSSKRIKYCASILEELLDRRHRSYVWPFYLDLDTQMLLLPDYRNLIRQPIDLSTIRSRLKTGEYDEPDRFINDFRLMFDNFYTYHSTNRAMMKLGRITEKLFERKLSQLPAESSSSSESESDDLDRNILQIDERIRTLFKQLSVMNSRLDTKTVAVNSVH